MQYTYHDLDDTIVALATPPGIGALAMIRLSGPSAIAICNALFPAKDLSKAAGHSVHFGTIRDETGSALDEILLTLFLGPRSYTGDDTVEMSCHGSPYIVSQLLQACIAGGARLARAGEYTQRAFLRGRMNLSQAEAVADLIAADSAAAHTMALRQLKGGYAKDLLLLREQLVHFASLIELELDFGEEDVSFADRHELQALLAAASEKLQGLLSSFQLGNAIKKGIPTVIAGRPNAGKSTLLNYLLQEERAIVSATPGTTRDTIEEVLNIKGLAFRLTDTAGLRQTEDEIEQIGVQRTLEKVKLSHLLLYVFDRSLLSPEEVLADLTDLCALGDFICLPVANKSDLPPLALLQAYAATVLPLASQVFVCSAQTGEGIPELQSALFDLALGTQGLPSADIVTNSRHAAALASTLHYLSTVQTGLISGLSGDLIAQQLRLALHHLGEITGQVSTDELLGKIFSSFCIGK